MKIILSLLLFFVCFMGHTQCYELIDEELTSIDEIPYALIDKKVIECKSGKQINLKLRNIEYKTKLGFIFKSSNLGDTLDVTLLTLNRKVLNKKRITQSDNFLRHEPFKKSENYFIIINTKALIDSTKQPITGCLGVVILERVKRKALKPVQKIHWEVKPD